MTHLKTAPLPTRPHASQTPGDGDAPHLPLLRRLTIAQKLTTLGLLLGLPLAGLSVLVGAQDVQQYRAASQQLQIAGHYGTLERLQLQLREIRGSAPQQVSAQQLQQLQQVDRQLQDILRSSEAARSQQLSQALSAKLGAIVQAIRTESVSAAELAQLINGVLGGELAQLFTTLATEGQLSSVRVPGGAALVRLTSETMAEHLPEVGRQFTTILPILDQALTRQGGVLTGEQRSDIKNAVQRARELTDAIERGGNEVLAARPDLRAQLAQPYAEANEQTRKLFDFVEQRTLEPRKVTTTFQQLLNVANPTLPAQYRAFDLTTAALRGIFEQQRAQAQRRLLALLLLLALVAALLALLLRAVSRAITQPLGDLTRASRQLSEGDLSASVPVTTADEFALLGHSFNAATAELREQQRRTEKERLEAQQLQNNIGAFLNVTVDIAGGDLTRRGVVTQDVLGNVVDSVNLMTEELAGTLKQVQQTSQAVGQGSQQLLTTTAQIEQGSLTTAQQAGHLAERARQIDRQIQDLTRSAQASAEAARQALETSEQGQQAVQGTLQGMSAIRSGTQDVAQTMQALSERSEQIQGIVDTITQIASQTNLLSLHASIEAAGAGEAGSRFAVVADEVRQLAEQTNEAAGRVAALITGLQSEIARAQAGVHSSAAQVERGYRVAEEAGARLQELGHIAQRSAQLAGQMSDVSGTQARDIAQLGQGVQDIAALAQNAQQSVQQGRGAAEQLRSLATQLEQSLSRFRLG